MIKDDLACGRLANTNPASKYGFDLKISHVIIATDADIIDNIFEEILVLRI